MYIHVDYDSTIYKAIRFSNIFDLVYAQYFYIDLYLVSAYGIILTLLVSLTKIVVAAP